MSKPRKKKPRKKRESLELSPEDLQRLLWEARRRSAKANSFRNAQQHAHLLREWRKPFDPNKAMHAGDE